MSKRVLYSVTFYIVSLLYLYSLSVLFEVPYNDSFAVPPHLMQTAEQVAIVNAWKQTMQEDTWLPPIHASELLHLRTKLTEYHQAPQPAPF